MLRKRQWFSTSLAENRSLCGAYYETVAPNEMESRIFMFDDRIRTYILINRRGISLMAEKN